MSVTSEELEPRRLFALTVTPFNPVSGAATLASALLTSGTGLTLTGATFTGANAQAGTYAGFNLTSGSNTLQMPDGIVLTSGVASSASPPVHAASASLNSAGDSQLATLLGIGTHDANILTIQFTADSETTQSISFDLLFGSDEFPQYVGAFNDGFGAFLDGVQISFDSSSNPITVNNNFFAYDNTNATNYGKTASNFAVGYQGLTTALRTAAPLDPNVATHTLKLALADAGDTSVDSGIFLANLRGSGTTLVSPSTDNNLPGTLAFAASTATAANTDGTVSLTVNRTGGDDGAVTINYATSNGTATAGTHYTATSGTLTFADGETSKTISVPILDVPGGDASATFTVTLSSPTNGAALGAQATQTVTIQNSRSVVALASAAYSAGVSDGSVVLTVNRTGNTSYAGAIDYATSDGTALAGSTYTAASGTLDFSAGQTSKTITVALLDNPAAAASTAFNLTLSNPGAATLLGSQSSSVVTLTNSRSAVSLSNSAYVATSTQSVATITVNRVGNTGVAASVHYATANGTAHAGTNYTASLGTLSFSAGETSKAVNVPIIANPGAAASTQFTFTLSSPGAATAIGSTAQAAVTISNAQSLIELASITSTASALAGTVDVVVTRTGNTSAAATVDYTTSDGTASGGRNFTAASGTITFAAGETSKTISLDVLDAPAASASTAFTLSLSNPTGAAALGTQTTNTITLQNGRSVVALSAAAFAASAAAPTVALTLTRTGNTSLPASVVYVTGDGTAISGTNYSAANGTVSFAAGETTATITVPIGVNPAAPASSNFVVALADPGASTVIGAQSFAVVSIQNDQSLLRFESAEYEVDESEGSVTLVVHRYGNLDAAATVQYTTDENTAVPDTHYTPQKGVLTFEPGQMTAPIVVKILPNVPQDAALTFDVSLFSPGGNAVIGDPSMTTVTIDDFAPPTLSDQGFSTSSDDGETPSGSNGGGSSRSTSSRIRNLFLSFDKPLPSEPDIKEFELFRRVQERPGGAAQRKPIVISGVSYNPESKTVNIRPSKKLRGDRFYQVIASFPIVQEGQPDEVDPDAPPDFTLTFGRGRQLTYIDRDGNRVRLKLRGSGVMQLVRSSDGQGGVLAIEGADATTQLTGKVTRSRFRTATTGSTTLTKIIGLGEGKNLLPSAIAVTQG